MNAGRVVLGIDPGIALLGYGVILALPDRLLHLEHGCISTSSNEPMWRRLRVIYEGLSTLRRRHQVTDVAMETLFYAKHVTTATVVGQARGVALLATVDEEIAFGEYAPTAVKQAVAGHGGAKKRQMQDMVGLMLGLNPPPTPDDAADALAVAICHARHRDLAAQLVAAGFK